LQQSIFESKSISKAYFSLAVPVVLSMVITIVYNITDTYFIALTRDTHLVAGVSLCAPVFTLLMGFGNIFGQGGSSLISRFLAKTTGRTCSTSAPSAFGRQSSLVLFLPC